MLATAMSLAMMGRLIATIPRYSVIAMITAKPGSILRQAQALCACPPKPAIENRPLISPRRAKALMSVFKVLANDTRLRLLHALARNGELCVSELAALVNMGQTAVSNQLQRLHGRGILESRRAGNQIFYCIVDPCVIALLDLGLCLTEDARKRHQ